MAPKARARAAAPVAPPARPMKPGTLRVPLAFTLVLAAFLALPRIHDHGVLAWSFLGAVAGLAAWLAWLWPRAATRALHLEIALRPQHYLQALAHTAIFVYWGVYWAPIRDAAALIAAQIVFAYAFDALLSWSRRDTYTLGFGPFPIIYSTNLFLRFHDDWFYLQFAMVAVGFLAKELIRWNREGREVHVFNPSSFPLAVFSLGLAATGTTHITWGIEIANELIVPPQIYLFIFLVSLPGQFLFRVTTMTLPAALTTYLFSVFYLHQTATYYFFDSNIPIAVFLGMHLLFTDPSTAPRTEVGRVIFGVIYGASVVGLYWLLGAIGVPTFYDKLLQVPLMNLMVRRIDALARSRPLAWADPERWRFAPGMRSVVYVSMWVIVFGSMSAANGVGDHHPGFSIPFWERSCEVNRDVGCRNLAIRQSQACRAGSGWACNELAILTAGGRVVAAPPKDLFHRACGLQFGEGCQNEKAIAAGGSTFRRGDPSLDDFRLVLQEGKGALLQESPRDLFSRACDQGYAAGCGGLGELLLEGAGNQADGDRAVELLQRACDGGHGRSCLRLGLMYWRGDVVVRDRSTALQLRKRACDLGLAAGCAPVEDARAAQ